MKKLLFVFAIPLLFILGCKNPCKDTDCLNFGTCYDGICICPPGFEGTNCEINNLFKFLGNYNVAETCDTNPASFSSEIRNGDAIGTLEVDNFWGLYQNSVVLLLDESNSNRLIIASQDPDTDGFVVEGSGLYDEQTGSIAFSYTVFNVSDGATDDCVATYQ